MVTFSSACNGNIFGLCMLRNVYEEDHGPLESGFVKRDLKFVAVAEVLSIALMYGLINVLWRW